MPNGDRIPINLPFRISVALGVALSCVFILVVRLWYLQIVRGDFFRDRSENNRLRTVYLPSPRGLILDRNGALLAGNRPAFNVDLVLEDAPDPKQSVRDLAELVGVDGEELWSRVETQNRRRKFEPKSVLRDVSRTLVAQISAQRHRLPGIVVNVAPTREYVQEEGGAHLIGYIREISTEQLKSAAYRGYRMGDSVGQSGIEASYERYLRGERGYQKVIVTALGNKIGEGSLQAEQPGSNVELTIDLKVQRAADAALAGKRGAIVALDVRTGEVLAMASAPTFNPNIFTGELSREDWAALTEKGVDKLSNRALQGTYPPGSVFKIFVAIAALAEGVVSPHERMTCTGAHQLGGRLFRCHKHSGHGSVDLFEALVQSCDVYFYTVGQRLSVDRIFYYAHDLFAFGQPTQIELGDESSGLIPSTQWKKRYFSQPQDQRWYPGETLPVAIGQGAVTTTPLQVARSLAAVVNGGRVLRPRIVKRVVSHDGRLIEAAPEQPEEVGRISGEVERAVLDQVRKAMVGVVLDPRGTGHRAALPPEEGIVVGGKTGTAQVAGRDAAIKKEDHAWFAGYAPADKPEIAVVALVENGGHGGAVAAPLVREVLAAYFGVAKGGADEISARVVEVGAD